MVRGTGLFWLLPSFSRNSTSQFLFLLSLILFSLSTSCLSSAIWQSRSPAHTTHRCLLHCPLVLPQAPRSQGSGQPCPPWQVLFGLSSFAGSSSRLLTICEPLLDLVKLVGKNPKKLKKPNQKTPILHNSPPGARSAAASFLYKLLYHALTAVPCPC